MANIVRRMAEQSKGAVERWLPEAFLFAILLTFVAYVLAIVVVEPQDGYGSLAQGLLIEGWYGGFWSLLSFAMQMTLILMTGYALAQTDIVDGLLSWTAQLASTEKGAAALVPVVAAIASFIHWGLGLVVGAIFAQKVAQNIRTIDFPIIVAGAYSGFIVWHGGLAGSIPLLLNTEGNFLIEKGLLSSTIPTGATIFTVANITLVIVVGLIFLPLLYVVMYPDSEEKKTPLDPASETETVTDGGADTDSSESSRAGEDMEAPTPTTGSMAFADRLEHSRLIAWVIGIAGLIAVVLYFALPAIREGVLPWNNLNLNIVNFTFLFLGLVLHGTPAAYIDAMKEAVENVWGIILQFPFYAGIMGILSYAPEGSVSLAVQIAQGMVALAPPELLPAVAFLTAGVVNVFVPSGGGEWIVIGETMVRAAKASGTSVERIAMATAWGDAWTNMIQPFWAIPLLAISGLSVRDIMGYCVMVLIGSGVIILIGITYLPM
jgi:short-chain fatty acids transporter